MHQVEFKQGSGVRAWVIFTGKTEIFWLRLLRPGFRHCWVLIHDGTHWISVDPLSNHMDVLGHYHIPADFDLLGWLAAREPITVIQAPVFRNKRCQAPIGFMSCVEVIKRILGIHAFWVMTPWDLCRHLKTIGGTEWKPKPS